MHGKVSASSVYELTAAYAFLHHSAGTPPASEYMIGQIRRNIYLQHNSSEHITQQPHIL